MEKRGRADNIILALVVIIAVFHSTYHFAVYGTGISGFFESGVSGFSVGKFTLGEEIEKGYREESLFSKIFIIFEWVVVIVFFIAIYARHVFTGREDFVDLNLKLVGDIKRSRTTTDLDSVYEILKQKKRLKFSVISKSFNVDKSVVENWARILEEVNLAVVIYPRIGEPELVLKEENVKEGGLKKEEKK